MYGFRSMNTSIETYYLSRQRSLETETWFHHVEKTLSRFLTGSELSQLNRTEDIPFLAGDMLYEAVSAADRFYLQTGGLFDPYLRNELRRIGYDRSFEKIQSGKVAPAPAPDFQSQKIHPADVNHMMKMITLHGATIDLGGIGKGWAAQQAADQLQKRNVCCGGISAGGDIVVWGKPEADWSITISSPESWNDRLFSFCLDRPAGIATSSTIKRSWKDQNGKICHHILDPRTRRSADSDLIQVSVAAPDLTTAEVYAKCLIILGWEQGLNWMVSKRKDLGAIGVKADRSVVTGGAIHDYTSKGLVFYDQQSAEQHS
jgi:Membrane-associated lipoprotein involved in thiamine biosynthesis